MSWLAGIMIIAGFFVLRLGAPLAAIFVMAYLLHRMEANWQINVG